MVEIEKPRIECVENPGDGSYGKYVVGPLERGRLRCGTGPSTSPSEKRMAAGPSQGSSMVA